MKTTSTNNERLILLGPGLAAVPESLLLAHARGEVLFIAGAGVSQPAKLPNFHGLVIQVYEHIDGAVHEVISKIPPPPDACFHWSDDFHGLNDLQLAEVRRFINGDYDVVLGMLERRIEGKTHGKSNVRQKIAQILRNPDISPAPIHKALMQLADRGGISSIVTTNFELLLEDACKNTKPPLQTYSLGGIPRPGRGEEFAGIMHIHGALDRNPARASDLIVTDQDFGEFYLRRRVVPDFIYDAARLYNLVLVGYSANDPPMRYLLNAVAADGTRFGDLKERFAFVGLDAPDSVALEDWRGRGITPIPYDAKSNHAVLLDTLGKWATLSATNGKTIQIDATIKRIVKKKRSAAHEADRDLFDHLFRRSNPKERERISALLSAQKADFEWLQAITEICSEHSSEVNA